MEGFKVCLVVGVLGVIASIILQIVSLATTHWMYNNQLSVNVYKVDEDYQSTANLKFHLGLFEACIGSICSSELLSQLQDKVFQELIFLDQTIAVLILSILSGSGALLHALLYSCCAAKAARLANAVQVFLKISLFLLVAGAGFFSGLSCLYFHLSKDIQDAYEHFSYGYSFHCALAATFLHLGFGLLMTVGVLKIVGGFSRSPAVAGVVTAVPTAVPIHTLAGYPPMAQQQQPMTYYYAGPQVEMSPSPHHTGAPDVGALPPPYTPPTTAVGDNDHRDPGKSPLP